MVDLLRGSSMCPSLERVKLEQMRQSQKFIIGFATLGLAMAAASYAYAGISPPRRPDE